MPFDPKKKKDQPPKSDKNKTRLQREELLKSQLRKLANKKLGRQKNVELDMEELQESLDFASLEEDILNETLPFDPLLDLVERRELASEISFSDVPSRVPVLPLRDNVVFHGTIVPVIVGRPRSLEICRKAYMEGTFINVIPQIDPDVEDPTAAELASSGVICQVVELLDLPGNMMKVLLHGMFPVTRFTITKHRTGGLSSRLKKTSLHEIAVSSTEIFKLLLDEAETLFEQYIHENPNLPNEIIDSLDDATDLAAQAFIMASYLNFEDTEKVDLLTVKDAEQLYEKIVIKLRIELSLMEMNENINGKVTDEIQNQQRKYFISEQIRLLQEELGEDEFGDPELAKIKEVLDNKPMPESVKTKGLEELKRLRKTPQMSPEYSVAHNFLDWIVALPWGEYSTDNLDIANVSKRLDSDHFGLEKPKERILEHIAVLNLVEKMRGQILCFVGPPGTGKTSLAQSIATALDRKSVRIALGGVHDEAEIRGHRKTYIGSMPGRIIQAIKKGGTMNPVIILDEIDKLGKDIHGDPSSAILEVLDPEQNHAFNDHYLDVDFDLSEVMFITTANVAEHIQPPLLDRMEIIQLPGYLEHDKLEIAKQHLIPRLLKNHGLKTEWVNITEEAIYELIRDYTSEAGVRNLEQHLASLCRKIAKKIVASGSKNKNFTPITVDVPTLHNLLGVAHYRDRLLERNPEIGLVNGLAWTSTGGAILEIEVAVMPGKNNFILTGRMGKVMKESAQAALGFVRSQSVPFGLAADFFEKNELHIHIPEGATPKDGPSAGAAMATAIISLLTRRKVRSDLAMTGEMTLRGNILRIGGLNEKLLAAQRNRIKTVLIPKTNEWDLDEIPAKVKEGLEIIAVDHIDEVLKLVFVK